MGPRAQTVPLAMTPIPIAATMATPATAQGSHARRLVGLLDRTRRLPVWAARWSVKLTRRYLGVSRVASGCAGGRSEASLLRLAG